jgi:hypothetical protein
MLLKRTLAFGVFLCIFALVLPSTAQRKKREDANTRTVHGVVTDNSDNPLNGAVVQLKDTKTLQVRSFITQKEGTYHFAGLSTNVDYELRAEHSGASSGTKTLSVFDDRRDAVINLKVGK